MDFALETGFCTGDEKLFLILGCGTTTIYTADHFGESVSVLCLESTGGDMDLLRMLLAHEYTHIVRRKLVQKDQTNVIL